MFGVRVEIVYPGIILGLVLPTLMLLEVEKEGMLDIYYMDIKV